MPGILRSKTGYVLVFVILIFVISVAGGVLGDKFGGGFLGAPIAHIQLPAEPLHEEELFSGFKVTNTMLTTWAAILVITTLSFFATRRMNDVPRGLQNFFEAIIEFFMELATSIAGPEKARRFLPLSMTIFIFIVTANWMGILPGFGTIGRIESAEHVKHHAKDKYGDDVDLSTVKLQIFDVVGGISVLLPGSVGPESETDYKKYKDHSHTEVNEDKKVGLLVPYLRSANTEVNTTLAIAIVAMVMIHFWGFRTLGVFGHAGKFLNFKGGPVALFVGILEIISEVARLISFTFRLFGNIFAGEVLLIAIAFLLPLIGIIPFLGLELFVGLIQALIFSILTLVFAALSTTGHDSEHH